MSMNSFFSRFDRFPTLHRAAIALVALAWSSLAICAETQHATMDGVLENSVRYGRLEEVKASLNTNSDLISIKNYYGETLLHLAARWGQNDVAKLLLANKADINSKDKWGETPLRLAADNGYRNMVDLLLASNAVYDVFDASAIGDIEKVKAFVNINPALVNCKDTNCDSTTFFHMLDFINMGISNSDTPLHFAAESGHKNVAELLLENKADVNAKDNNGMTPLFCAVCGGHKDMIELLLSHKADVNAADALARTPLLCAASRGDKEVVELLLTNGADVNAKDYYHSVPLFFASAYGHNDVVKVLLAHGANINAPDNGGKTCLQAAARNNHKSTVELLLANGADINAQDNYGSTALDLASAYVDVADLLRQHGGIKNRAPPWNGHPMP